MMLKKFRFSSLKAFNSDNSFKLSCSRNVVVVSGERMKNNQKGKLYINIYILFIVNQKKLSRVPSCIGHASLKMEGHLNIHLQSF